MLESNKIRRFHIPGFPGIAWTFDEGQAFTPGHMMFQTHLQADHMANGKLVQSRDLGSGVITNIFVNTLVTDAVAGNTNNDLFIFRYMDSGTGAPAVDATNTALTTPGVPARVAATLSNAQTSIGASGGIAKLQYQATIAYSGASAVTEWGMFSLATAGNMIDHKLFSAINVNAGDSIQFTYILSLPSAG